MTDTQLLTIGLSLIIPITLGIAALIHSNGRIAEAKETLRAEMALGFEHTRAEMQALRAEMNSRFDKLADMLKIHELEHHR